MNITPKDKANQLIEKFREFTPAEGQFEYPHAVECALILCDEFLHHADNEWVIDMNWNDGQSNSYDFWKAVRKELELLKS